MKSMLMAAMIAVGGVAAAIIPAQAASVVIRTDNGWHQDHHHYRHHWRHHERHCRVEVRHSWHHGHRVVSRVRVCE